LELVVHRGDAIGVAFFPRWRQLMANDANNGERLPPQSREAERGVLGSMLRDNHVINDIVQIIRQDSFYFDAHQKIYQAMVDLYDAHQPVDLVILAEKLKQLGHIEDVGGYGYLGELWDAAPTAANGEYYARIVREKGIVRALIHTSTEILRDAYDQVQPADELLAKAEREVLEIAEQGVTGTTSTLQQAINEAYARLDARKQGGHSDVSGIATGFTDLDHLTAGLQNNELIILAARPSVGKTAMALNIVRHVVVDEQIPVFFVSLEQARIELAERLLVAQARVDSHKLRKAALNSDEMKRLLDAGGRLHKAKLFIDDTPSQGMLRIAANARRLKMREDIRMVVIDYLQLIDPENRRDPRQEQVAQISRRLKFLARELKIPVIALAQVNRSSEDRQDHRPRLSDLRESGSIEQDADTVFLLHRPGRSDSSVEDNTIEVLVAKQRNGPTGDITLAYRKEFMRFENFAIGDGYSIDG
jgi:replicative DNA helicase